MHLITRVYGIEPSVLTQRIWQPSVCVYYQGVSATYYTWFTKQLGLNHSHPTSTSTKGARFPLLVHHYSLTQSSSIQNSPAPIVIPHNQPKFDDGQNHVVLPLQMYKVLHSSLSSCTLSCVGCTYYIQCTVL